MEPAQPTPATGGATAAGPSVSFGSRSSINIRPHAWDDAEVFAIRYHDGEWPPFSPRSAAGSATFPAAYVGDEHLDGDDLTLWYVAHVHFDEADLRSNAAPEQVSLAFHDFAVFAPPLLANPVEPRGVTALHGLAVPHHALLHVAAKR